MLKQISILACVAAATFMTGVVFRESLTEFHSSEEPTVAPELPSTVQTEEIDVAAIRKEASRRIQPTLQWADQQAKSELTRHLKSVDEFFAKAKAGARPFAEDALSFSSKWRLAADYVPFTDGNRNRSYMSNSFRRHILKPNELAYAIEKCLRGYQQSLKSIENKMLVKMRADVADLPPIALPEFSSNTSLMRSYQDAVQQSIVAAERQATAGIGTEVASVVAGEVLASVAMRLGVSSGIVTAGAASGPVTFGVGVVAGLIVDQMVSWVWNWWADPTGDIARKIQYELSRVHRLTVTGDSRHKGLRGQMEDITRERSRVRRIAVSSLLAEG